jgi:polysaccharide biosynthesis protein PslG
VSRARAWVLRVAALVCAALCLPAAIAQDSAAGSPPPFIVGVGQSIHDPPGAAAAVSGLGVQSMRLDAPWQLIETGPGRYAIPAWLEAAVNSANARGIEPLLILAYGHPLYGMDKPRTPAAITAFARYAVFVTEHFEGRVRYYDLWNEWDVGTGRTTFGSADDYVALARRVYPAIKSANDDAIVLSGGVSNYGLAEGWIERFIELGGLRFVDGMSVHPYNYQQSDPGAPERAIAELDRVHGLLRAAGRGELPIYVTEMGYPAFAGRFGLTQELAAAYLARFLLLASTRPYVAGTWWYCLRDQGSDPNEKEHHFGVLDTALRPKPAAGALRAVATLLADVKRFRIDDLDSDSDGGDGAGLDRRVVATRADGTELVLAWNQDDTDGRLLLEELGVAGAPDARAASAGPRR